MSDTYHISVLEKEAIAGLEVIQGKKYIDATLGGGGHAFEILKQGGEILGLDTDQEAIEYVSRKFQIGKGVILTRGNFRNIGDIARRHGFEKVSGILFDLGVSSHQIDSGERGFSFQKDAALDMRMDKDLQVTASDLLQVLTKKELCDVFQRLGEERYAWKIAENIVRARQIKPIQTTQELVGIIEKAVGQVRDPKERAQMSMRVFQALRIAVNDELLSLELALPAALTLLEDKGRLVVISFHSLEDRIVKQTFLQFAQDKKGSVITKKPLEPSEQEIMHNPRSRSAKMRIFERKIL